MKLLLLLLMTMMWLVLLVLLLVLPLSLMMTVVTIYSGDDVGDGVARRVVVIGDAKVISGARGGFLVTACRDKDSQTNRHYIYKRKGKNGITVFFPMVRA